VADAILVLNAGSSSLKFSLFLQDNDAPVLTLRGPMQFHRTNQGCVRFLRRMFAVTRRCHGRMLAVTRRNSLPAAS
jgi:hypothetical protein